MGARFLFGDRHACVEGPLLRRLAQHAALCCPRHALAVPSACMRVEEGTLIAPPHRRLRLTRRWWCFQRAGARGHAEGMAHVIETTAAGIGGGKGASLDQEVQGYLDQLNNLFSEDELLKSRFPIEVGGGGARRVPIRFAPRLRSAVRPHGMRARAVGGADAGGPAGGARGRSDPGAPDQPDQAWRRRRSTAAHGPAALAQCRQQVGVCAHEQPRLGPAGCPRHRLQGAVGAQSRGATSAL